LHAIPPCRLERRRLPTPGPQIRANTAATAPEPWPVPAFRPPASGSAAVNPAAQAERF
jgi:hypothetical protein